MSGRFAHTISPVRSTLRFHVATLLRREPVDPLILLAISAEFTWSLMTTIHLVSSALIPGFERRLEVGGFLLLEDSLWPMSVLDPKQTYTTDRYQRGAQADPHKNSG